MHRLCDDFAAALAAASLADDRWRGRCGVKRRFVHRRARRRRRRGGRSGGSRTTPIGTKSTIPMPPKGEALRNPFYAAQRFAEALGARTAWDRELTAPARDGVIVLSGWHWTLSANGASSARALGRVGRAAGGRSGDLSGGEDEFEAWSGIVRDISQAGKQRTTRTSTRRERQSVPAVQRGRRRTGRRGNGREPPSVVRCDLAVLPDARTSRRPGRFGTQPGCRRYAWRSAAGSVTVINASPFRYREPARRRPRPLFVAATGLRRGDDVHFLSEDDHPSLLALVWRYGAPVVVLALGAGRRSACGAAPSGSGRSQRRRNGARRSLAEQIRGTGSSRCGTAAASRCTPQCVRALDEAARRAHCRVMRGCSPKERAAALARLTGFDASALDVPRFTMPARAAGHELRSTIALLEDGAAANSRSTPTEARTWT